MCRSSSRLACVVSIALLAACPARQVSKVDPNQAKEVLTDIPVEINRDIDILFVVDNSGSMQAEQTSLKDNFDRFINVLQSIKGGLPNVHIGVISPDLGAGPYGIRDCNGSGDNGTLQSAPRSACTPPAGAFIRDIGNDDGTRTTNYEGTLADTFGCIAELGIDGCGFEQPLEAMRRALNGSNATNEGFLRDDAFLAVIFITDEDDCSTRDSAMFDTNQTSADSELGRLHSFRCFEFGVSCENDVNPRTPGVRENCIPQEDSPYMHGVQEYVDFLRGLKDDPEKVIVAGIIGNPGNVRVIEGEGIGNLPPGPELDFACRSSAGRADPGIRMKAFLDGFPTRNTFTTICNDNLADALILVADLLAKSLGNPCLAGDLDTDPETEGVQPQCEVSDIRYPDTDRHQETPLDECSAVPPPAGELPCWHLVRDEDTCMETQTNLALVVERGAGSVPTGTETRVRCVVQ